jgi:hypothetical protein
MAKHFQNLSKHQEGIVKRYYSNQDAISITKLMELTSELAIAEDPKVIERLWKRVELALAKTDLSPEKVKSLLQSRNVKLLAEVVGKLAKP